MSEADVAGKTQSDDLEALLLAISAEIAFAQAKDVFLTPVEASALLAAVEDGRKRLGQKNDEIAMLRVALGELRDACMHDEEGERMACMICDFTDEHGINCPVGNAEKVLAGVMRDDNRLQQAITGLGEIVALDAAESYYDGKRCRYCHGSDKSGALRMIEHKPTCPWKMVIELWAKLND